MIEYVFATLASIRLRQGYDLDEAAHTAAIFMSAPIMALAVIFDIVVSDLFGSTPVYRMLGKWPFGLLLFVSIYVIHYFFLIRGGRAQEIVVRVKPPESMMKTYAIALSYVLLIPVLSIVIGYLYQQ